VRDLSASVVAAAARRPASIRVVALPEQLQRSGESGGAPDRAIAPKAQGEVLNPVAATTRTNWEKAAADLARAKLGAAEDAGASGLSVGLLTIRTPGLDSAGSMPRGDCVWVDADGRLFTEQRHDSVLTVDKLVQAARARTRPLMRQTASISRKRNPRVDRSLGQEGRGFLASAATSHGKT
jgi:hypothetical protein